MKPKQKKMSAATAITGKINDISAKKMKKQPCFFTKCKIYKLEQMPINSKHNSVTISIPMN